jgi:hypothetical protein
MIIQNQMQCLNCNDIIVSKHRHDYVSCKCGNVSVDGGMSYRRRTYKDGAKFKELSLLMATDTVDAGSNAVKIAIATGRNDLGIFLAVVRALEADGYLIQKEGDTDYG